jgi:hypothetical protein
MRNINKMDPNEPFVHRPDPPTDLNPDEATEWREMVKSMPPAYFVGSHHERLAQLCRVTVASNQTSKSIVACRKTDNQEYVRLLNVQLKETDKIIRLSRALGFFRPSMFNQAWDRWQ